MRRMREIHYVDGKRAKKNWKVWMKNTGIVLYNMLLSYSKHSPNFMRMTHNIVWKRYLLQCCPLVPIFYALSLTDCIFCFFTKCSLMFSQKNCKLWGLRNGTLSHNKWHVRPKYDVQISMAHPVFWHFKSTARTLIGPWMQNLNWNIIHHCRCLPFGPTLTPTAVERC